jgi:predicted RNA-binding protein YlqC (UPF0109 family)
MNTPRELLEFILNSIPFVAGNFTIAENEDELGVTYKITVSPDAMPGLIGRQGRNIKAIRDVIAIVARQLGRRVFIKLQD